jgi:hypothetical protein
MSSLHPRRHVFRGHSTGIAAHIRRPDKHLVEVQGCSALPPTGGRHEDKAQASPQNDLISHGAISTSAHGDYVDEKAGIETTYGTIAFDAVPVETRVASRVENVDILGRVHIGLAKMGLTARSGENGDQPAIRLDGCALDDVRIGKYRLKFTFADAFYGECDTLKKMAAKHADKSAKKEDDHLCLLLPAETKYDKVTEGAGFPEADGTVKCTIVQKIEWDGPADPDAEIHGHVVYVHDFGRIYFGEMFITGTSRRLTMVRFQLGSPHGGEVVMADGESGVGTFPPT